MTLYEMFGHRGRTERIPPMYVVTVQDKTGVEVYGPFETATEARKLRRLLTEGGEQGVHVKPVLDPPNVTSTEEN